MFVRILDIVVVRGFALTTYPVELSKMYLDIDSMVRESDESTSTLIVIIVIVSSHQLINRTTMEL